MTTKKKTGTKTTKTAKTRTTEARKPSRPAAAKPARAGAPKAKAAPQPKAPAAPARKPAKSLFNKKEAEPYRRLLLDLKAKLIRDVRLNQEASNESPDGDVLDLADQASDSYDRDLANSLSETERGRLAAVENALRRVDEGGYGVCKHCSKAIPLARLKVLPFAQLCVPCQQGEESGAPRRSAEA